MKIKTYENNSMSLSCNGEMVIENGVIVSANWHGSPRIENRDSWVYYYHHSHVGKEITQETIDKILAYNGRHNVVSKIVEA